MTSGLHVSLAAETDENSETYQADDSIDVSIRPEKIHLSAQTNEKPSGYDNCYVGEVKHTLYTGPHIQCIIELTTGERLRVLQPNHRKYPSGSAVYVAWAAADCQILAAS